jgi:hypothetical protein
MLALSCVVESADERQMSNGRNAVKLRIESEK